MAVMAEIAIVHPISDLFSALTNQLFDQSGRVWIRHADVKEPCTFEVEFHVMGLRSWVDELEYFDANPVTAREDGKLQLPQSVWVGGEDLFERFKVVAPVEVIDLPNELETQVTCVPGDQTFEVGARDCDMVDGTVEHLRWLRVSLVDSVCADQEKIQRNQEGVETILQKESPGNFMRCIRTLLDIVSKIPDLILISN